MIRSYDLARAWCSIVAIHSVGLFRRGFKPNAEVCASLSVALSELRWLRLPEDHSHFLAEDLLRHRCDAVGAAPPDVPAQATVVVARPVQRRRVRRRPGDGRPPLGTEVANAIVVKEGADGLIA